MAREDYIGNLLSGLIERGYKYKYLLRLEDCDFIQIRWKQQLYFEDSILITIDKELNVCVRYYYEVSNSKFATPAVGYANVPYVYGDDNLNAWTEAVIVALKFIDRCYDSNIDVSFKCIIRDGKICMQTEGVTLKNGLPVHVENK